MKARVLKGFLRGIAIVLAVTTVSWVPVPAAAADDPTIVEAAARHDVKAIRELLRKGRAHVNARKPDGATALHWAAVWDDVEIADLLIRSGADVHVTNDLGVSPLALACENGNFATTERLVRAGANVNAGLPTGETPLMTASRIGHPQIVELLLARGADPNAKESVKGQTALMWAATQGHGPVVDLLLARGANVSVRSADGFSPILFAARAGNVDVIAALLKAGANVNDADPKGASVLHVATIRGHVDAAKVLLAHGADPNAAGVGFTPLHWAVGRWETTTTKAFPRLPGEWGSLMGVPSDRRLELIRALLAHGADSNAQLQRRPPAFGIAYGGTLNLATATPFLIAAAAADAAAMRMLAASGANPLAATTDKVNAVLAAAGLNRSPADTSITERSTIEALDAALSLGNDVNAVDSQGESALHAAAILGWNEVVKFLVQRGARLDIRNSRGQTALDATKPYVKADTFFVGQPATAELLRKLGAKDK